MAPTFPTIPRHWTLLGWACALAICTLATEFCANFQNAGLMCKFKNTCNHGICKVNLTSAECNITCECTDDYDGQYCNVSPTDGTIQPTHPANSSTTEPADCASDILTTEMVMCMQADGCYPGNCTIDTNVCAVACACPPGYHGAHCRDIIDTVTSVTSTISGHVTVSKKCGTEYTCDHGQCPTGHLPCQCDRGWDGPLCNLECNLTCTDRGVCKINNGVPWCNCIDHRHTGHACELVRTTIGPEIVNRTLIQREEADYRYIAGVVVGAVMFVLAVTAILCVILWKRRAIIILKLIYWFRPYEDDDCKLYDAFVSYKSSHSDGSHGSSLEEQFVIHTLMPKLEQELGFRLCVHFRDFLPGRHITENVLDAIENSRRTILLLSKNYIENSFWTRFEYEQAQVAAMERKQRIIPIIFEDISDAQIQDHTLQNILDSITYMTWPGQDGDSKKLNKFWTQLTLSMPKLMTSETVAPVSYRDTGVEESVVAKTMLSNGPYTSPETELEYISIDISRDKLNSKKRTDLINGQGTLKDKKATGVLPDHGVIERDLKAKAGEYVEMLECKT